MYVCPRCGSRLGPDLSECHGCGMPTTFMEPVQRSSREGEVVEPEVLDSIDDHRPGVPPQMRHTGCAVGPGGCGCLGLPLAVVVGVILSSVAALAWVLRVGQTVGAAGSLAARLCRGGRGRGGSRPA